LHTSLELPAATEDGERFWWREGHDDFDPLDLPPPPIVRHILIDGMYRLFDDRNPAHLAARDAKPAYGDRQLPDGSRKFVAPPIEWPPPRESVQGI
jgi:hypothetical protein